MYEKNSWLLNLVELHCNDIEVPAIFANVISRCFVSQYSKSQMQLKNLILVGSEIIIVEGDDERKNTFVDGDIIFDCGFLYSTIILYNDFNKFQREFTREKLIESLLKLVKEMSSLAESDNIDVYIKDGICLYNINDDESVELLRIFNDDNKTYVETSDNSITCVNDLSTREIARLYYEICDF